MSVRFVPVSWTPSKWVYDGVLMAATLGFLGTYFAVGGQATLTALDEQTLAIRAYGTCAFVLLSIVLAIGPLARLDGRFLPLLYNRRHFGVLVFVVAAAHAMAVLDWYFAYSPVDPLVALLSADAGPARGPGVPFVLLGIGGLLILFVMAATSHDFWLAFLGPPLWKAVHMGVYAAYALIVAHVAFGALQDARNAGLAVTVLACALTVTGLHAVAAWRGERQDRQDRRTRLAAVMADNNPWIDVADSGSIPPGGSLVVRPPHGEAVAIFNDGGALSAVSNVCAHQNGPLGEGRIVDGCVVCPWHGFQYRLTDGRAPAPFKERIATYRLGLRDGRLLLDPRPLPPGTPVEPVRLTGEAA